MREALIDLGNDPPPRGAGRQGRRRADRGQRMVGRLPGAWGRKTLPPYRTRREALGSHQADERTTMHSDKLTALDAGFLEAEDADPHVSMAIGALAMLEGPCP